MERRGIEAALFSELAPRLSRSATAAIEMGRGRPLVDEILSHAPAGAATWGAPRALRARAALHAGSGFKRKPGASAATVARTRSVGDVSHESLQRGRATPQAASRAATNGARAARAISESLRVCGRRSGGHRDGAPGGDARHRCARRIASARAASWCIA